jgi:hypothetical protein
MAGAFLSDMETLRRRHHADRDVVLPLLNEVLLQDPGRR